MKIFFSRWAALAILAVPFALLPAGCAVGPDGYGYDDDAAGVDYYDAYGADYGGWDSGYYVGPYRGSGGDHHDGGGEHRGEAGDHHHGTPHAFRPAAPSRSVPSIPSQPRGGGGGRRR